MEPSNSVHRSTSNGSPTFMQRLRFVLLSLGVLLVLGAAALVASRQSRVAAFEAAWTDFEAQVGPLHERPWDPAVQQMMEQELEAFHEVRQLHAAGVDALQTGRLDEAIQQVERVEDLRRGYLHDDTRLVDLMLAHASGRFGLDLAADLLESPGLSNRQLERLQETFDAAWDHRGVDRAMAYEAELLLAGHAHVAHIGLSERFYQWLHGPADQAAGLRLYAALAEAMYEPVLDVRTHLIESSQAEGPAFGVVSNFLVVHIQDVPLNHRFQTTSRRLMRLATEVRLAAQHVPPTDLSTPDSGVDAVTGGHVVWRTEPDGSKQLIFPDALDVLTAKLAEAPPRDTAPPSVPLQLRLPPPR